jgi:hypothetical protein
VPPANRSAGDRGFNSCPCADRFYRRFRQCNAWRHYGRRREWRYATRIDSVISGYPFPEIYVADGDVNLDTGQGTQLLVDGLQRVTTLVQYFTGNEELKLTTVPLYKSLNDQQKTAFLQYDVSVRDLGAISKEEIVEVFRRINSTSYSLTDIEISNAIYRGKFKEFAEKLSLNEFFVVYGVFSSLDYRRMGDLRYAVLLTATVLGGYFNRDELFEEFLDRYNDEFPAESECRQISKRPSISLPNVDSIKRAEFGEKPISLQP